MVLLLPSVPARSFLSRVLLRVLPAAAVLATTATPIDAVVDSRPAAPTEWMLDYIPAPFLRSPEGRDPIDPANFREPLLSAAIFQETNRQRVDLGLPAFSSDERASKAARSHARWMAGTHALSHEEPSDQGSAVTALDRLVQQGLRPCATAENIAYNLLPDITPGRPFYTRLENGQPVYSYRPGGAPLRARTYDGLARIIVAQWMHSPGHRAHIVSPGLRYLGVGVALAHRRGHPDTIYGVQDFYTPPISSPSSDLQSGGFTLLPRP